ncbi:MAG: DUF4838 domain-containing protein [Kiritimatiellae bacterium]|nr:DUF4838 domain-containing protein [Kiritimatiellia bacterium]
MKQNRFKTLVLLTFWVGVTAPLLAQNIKLAENGASTAVIVVPAQATGGTRAAADELQAYLEKSTGVKLPIRAETPDLPKPQLHVGWTEFAKSVKLDFTGLDKEAFRIRSFPETQAVVIVGNSEPGLSYAVSDFLEHEVGIRFYMPGAIGTHIPKHSTLEIPALERMEQPAYLERAIAGQIDPGLVWTRRVRVHDHGATRLHFHHQLGTYFPMEKYGQTHPEYFALHSGSRDVPKTKEKELYAQYCLSNPEVIRIAVEHINGQFDQHPDQESISISMNDGASFCECERCVAQGSRGVVKTLNDSDYWFGFVNAVAAEVKKKHPKRLIGAFAYGPASVLPQKLDRLEDSVVVCLVQGQRDRDYDPAVKAEDDARLQGWSKFAKRLVVYDHLFDADCAVPAFYPALTGQILREPLDHGTIGYYAEIYPNFILSGPKTYIVAKLIWDAKEDPEKIVDEFCRDMFGAASVPMRAYFAFLEQCFMNQKRTPPGVFRNLPGMFSVYSPADFKKGSALLEKALKLADTPLAKTRAQFFADGFQVSQFYQRSWDLVHKLDSNVRDRASADAAVTTAEALLLNERRREAILDRLMRECELKPQYLRNFGASDYWRMRPRGQVALFNAAQWDAANRREKAVEKIEGILAGEGEEGQLAFAVFSEKHGDLDRSQKIYRTLMGPNHAAEAQAKAAYLLALQLSRLGRADDALQAIAPRVGAIKDENFQNQVKRLQVRLLFAAGHDPAALEMCESMSAAGRDVLEKAAPFLLAAEMMEAQGKAKQAGALYEKTLAIDPSRRAAMKLARLEVAAGRMEKARAIFETVHADSAEADYRLGVLLGELGRRDEAMALWKKVASLPAGGLAGRNAASRLALLGGGQPVSLPRLAHARRLSAPPKLDGRLEDPCWKQAEPLEGFGPINKTKGSVTQPTTGYLLYDDQALYLGLRAKEAKLGQLCVSKYLRDDTSMWMDDCLEVFIDPVFDSATYHYISLNAWGVYLDGYGLDWSYDGDFDVVTARGEGEWSVEMRLPFSELRVPRPKAGDVWGFNIGRERQPEPQEITSWAHDYTSWFQEADKFGCVVFE